jgi:hypothetical protein
MATLSLHFENRDYLDGINVRRGDETVNVTAANGRVTFPRLQT